MLAEVGAADSGDIAWREDLIAVSAPQEGDGCVAQACLLWVRVAVKVHSEARPGLVV